MTFRNSRNKRKRRLSSLGQVCELFSQPTLRQAGDFHTPRFSSLSGAESSTGERRYTLETFPFLQGFFILVYRAWLPSKRPVLSAQADGVWCRLLRLSQPV